MPLHHWQVWWCSYADIGGSCQKIRNSEVPNPNPIPFEQSDIACNSTKVYFYCLLMTYFDRECETYKSFIIFVKKSPFSGYANLQKNK